MVSGVERAQLCQTASHGLSTALGRTLTRVYFFTGPRDTLALAEFFCSRGMHLVSRCFEDDRDVRRDNLVDRPECRVSPVPYSQLRRDPLQHNPEMHEVHRNAIDTYGQPVIDWRRSHQDGHYLLAGNLEWADWSQSPRQKKEKDEELLRLNAAAGKVFRAARRWIHQRWTKRHGVFWYGPHALELELEGLTLTSFHPDKTTFSTIFVERATGEQTEVVASSFEEWSAVKRRPKPH